MLPGWGEFAVASALFLLSHVVPARPALRGKLVDLVGERAYLAAYGTISVVLLAWLIAAAWRAPYLMLWPYAAWRVWLANIVMPFACILVTGAVGAANPLSFGGGSDGFDPRHPGVAGIARHPLLLALALWAGVHAVANGDLAHVLLFGGFAIFAIMGMRVLDRRRRRLFGEPTWARLAAGTSLVPFAAWFGGRWRPRGRWTDACRVALGLLLWLVLLALHGMVIGVSPLPPG